MDGCNFNEEVMAEIHGEEGSLKKREKIYNGKIINVELDEYVLSDGTGIKREIVNHKPGAAILAKLDDQIVFVGQFRHAVKRSVWEIPAGLVEEGEDPKETAVRELQEEVGLKPLNLQKILTILPSPGFTDEKTTIFYADQFEESRLPQDSDEDITVCYASVETVERQFKEGFFKDAKTVGALGYYFSFLKK